MDVRLYILAGTFALMVVSLITVVVVAVRVRRREKSIRLDNLPAMTLSRPDFPPVDTDLNGLEVPVPAGSPHAALLTPLAERPVWAELADPSAETGRPPSDEWRPEARSDHTDASARTAAPAAVVSTTPVLPLAQTAREIPEDSEEPPLDPAAVEEPSARRDVPPIELPAPAETSGSASDIPEGRGRIPEIGRREVRRLPSAEEILASLEAEMARQESEKPEPTRAAAVADAPEIVPRRGTPVQASPAPEPEELAPLPAETTSSAGLPVEYVEWKPDVARSVASHEPAPHPDAAPASPTMVVSAITSTAAVPPTAPVAIPAPARAAAPRPVAVVRTPQPAASSPNVARTSDAQTTNEPRVRPAVRVAGIRVPRSDVGVRDDLSGAEASSGADAADIELSSPVEMWFGEHRIGVKQGTATFDRLQRYAETLLDDLRESRGDPRP